MTASSLSIVPPSGALGAEVTGMELGRSLDDNTFDVVQQALLHHLVLVVAQPGQGLTLSGRFGVLNTHEFVAGLPDYAEIIEIVNE